MGLVITLSGPIGSRRSELARRLANRLGMGPPVKFSDYIRACIDADGEDQNDRSLQQSYGQRLVQSRLDEFVRGVLALAPAWPEKREVIVDGLRHVECC